MPRIQYRGFCGPTYAGRSQSIATDRCINLYPEVVESGTGKNAYVLIGTPGIREIINLGSEQPIRGICTLGAKRILVAGAETLYDISPATGAASVIGAIAPDEEWDGLGAVTFAWNGNTYCVCSGGKLYHLDGSTLTYVLDAEQVQYLDGYYIALQPSLRKVRISALYDGLTWNELDFKEKESSRDYPAAILADHGELWVFGETHSEVWYNSGNSDFPFERVPNGRLELGIAAKWSAAKLDNSLFWIGNDERGNRVVWRADGYTAKRVSNHAVEYHLNLMIPQVTGASVTDVTSTFAICWAYQEEGHSFYQMIFPKAPEDFRRAGNRYSNPTSFVYDCATGMWHERAFWNPSTGQYEPPRQRCHAWIWDHHLVGDRANGKIYEQGLHFYDDNGDRIRRERIGPHISYGMKPVFYRSFQLDMEVAVGLGMIDSDLYGPDMYGKEYEP